METRNEYNISAIETKLYALLLNNVSAQVFPSTLPSVLSDSWNDMVLIDLGAEIEDRDAYAEGLADIVLFTRPRANGTKNVTLMSTMEKALNSVVDASTDTEFRLSRARAHTDFDSNINWHCNVITLNVRVY